MNRVDIYTDGACSGNPGPGGWAYIKRFRADIHRGYGGVPNTTNNRMEILAVLKALESLTEFEKHFDVIIYSDSAYVVNTINLGWLNNWITNGIQKANMDLWTKIYDLWDPKFKITKVKGHSDDQYNNECDRLAVEARLSIE